MKILLGIKELYGTDGTVEAIAKKYGCEFAFKEQNEITHDDLLDVDIVLGNPHESELHDLPKLKLVQLQSAGSDTYAKLPIFSGENAPILCNATGSYGVSIAEHMIGFLIVLARDYLPYRDNMADHKWSYLKAPETLYGKKALVMGLGDIGSHFAKLLDAFGCEVYAVKRTPAEPPAYIKEIHGMEDLDELLPQMDYVGICLPNSPSTTHIINERTLKLMKPSAFVINVGRGPAVDNMALAEALKNGTIAGAALDVTEPEPLPADHPLWDCKNCLITPHSSGMFFQRDPHLRILKLWSENLEAFFGGKPLKNVVDLTTGYRKK